MTREKLLEVCEWRVGWMLKLIERCDDAAMYACAVLPPAGPSLGACS